MSTTDGKEAEKAPADNRLRPSSGSQYGRKDLLCRRRFDGDEYKLEGM
jgi:hypothetical protein